MTTGPSADRATDPVPGPVPQRQPAPRGWRPDLPVLAVLALLVAGLVGVSVGHWRKGAVLMGCAPLLAALLRVALPGRRVGLLTIRGRGFDVVLLACIGLATIALAYVVPVYYHIR